MAKRTIDTGYFGSLGLGDAMSTFAEKTIRASWDFSKKNVTQKAYGSGAVVIPLMQIPKGFCIDRISVVQTKVMAADTTVTFGLVGDNSFTVGGNFALDSTEADMLRSCQDADATNKTARFVTDDDALCLLIAETASGGTAATYSAGAFDVCVHGFETFAEGPTANVIGEENYRKSLQTQDNVSGGQFPLD